MRGLVFNDYLDVSEKMRSLQAPKRHRYRLVLASFVIGYLFCLLWGV